VTDGTTTYTDPGFTSDDATAPNDAAFVNALLAAQASFNWTTHTWSHQFLGCNVAQPQALTSATPNATAGTLAAGSYSYEITAATAYGESEPSAVQTATVVTNGSVTLEWPDATNGTGAAGPGPTLALEEANHTGGTGFWATTCTARTRRRERSDSLVRLPKTHGRDHELHLHRHWRNDARWFTVEHRHRSDGDQSRH